MASQPDSTLLELTQKLQDLYLRIRNDPEEMAFLSTVLTPPPARESLPSLLPMHEYEIRLDLADKYLSWCRETEPNRSLDSIEFMVFMQAPVDRLRRWVKSPEEQYDTEGAFFQRSLDACTASIKAFLLRNRNNTKKGSEAGESSAASTGNSSKATYRNETQREYCLNRDGRACVVTGAIDPIVCHITPFFWTKSEGNASKYSPMIDRFAMIFGLDRKTAKLLRAPTQSDKAWNMICLSPTLHTFWGKGYFGFKVLSNKEEVQASTEDLFGVRIQFIWLPQPPRGSKNEKAGLRTVDLDQQKSGSGVSTYVDELRRFDPTSLRTDTFYCKEKWQVFSGRVFTIQLPKDDAPKFIRMMELQWALANLISMSGAADVDLTCLRSDFDEEPDYRLENIMDISDDDQPSERVNRWLEAIDDDQQPPVPRHAREQSASQAAPTPMSGLTDVTNVLPVQSRDATVPDPTAKSALSTSPEKTATDVATRTERNVGSERHLE